MSLVILAGLLTTASSCGGPAPPPPVAHPDTGIGGGETPPATVNCLDLCLRGAYCAGALCNEDTMSTGYTALAEQLDSQCEIDCSVAETLVSSRSTTQTTDPTTVAAEWQCMFQSSCRQVFQDDVCGVQATYSCGA